MKKREIDVKEMIAAVYFKIQISRDLIDLPKESIKCEKVTEFNLCIENTEFQK